MQILDGSKNRYCRNLEWVFRFFLKLQGSPFVAIYIVAEYCYFFSCVPQILEQRYMMARWENPNFMP